VKPPDSVLDLFHLAESRAHAQREVQFDPGIRCFNSHTCPVPEMSLFYDYRTQLILRRAPGKYKSGRVALSI
jgi:hypothetical protein